MKETQPLPIFPCGVRRRETLQPLTATSFTNCRHLKPKRLFQTQPFTDFFLPMSTCGLDWCTVGLHPRLLTSRLAFPLPSSARYNPASTWLAVTSSILALSRKNKEIKTTCMCNNQQKSHQAAHRTTRNGVPGLKPPCLGR